MIAALQPRILKSVCTLTAEAGAALAKAFPYVCRPCGSGQGNSDARPPCLPNVVDGVLLLGHQGHAAAVGKWADGLRCCGVVNLAPDKVPGPRFAPTRCSNNYHPVVHPGDGLPLRDTAGAEVRAFSPSLFV